MKLKGKLASEYARNPQKHNFPTQSEAWLAGFEKAKELAQFECTRFMEYEMPEVLDIEIRIGELGEEEISR